MGNVSSTDRKAFKKAIKQNDVRSVFELLRSGADADLPLDLVWEHTPLILATSYGAHRVVPIILRVCRQKDAQNYEGHTALDKAIIYFSLSCQFFQHKPTEIERRYAILKSLIEGGCKKVKIPDVELWIKVNKRDNNFIHSFVRLMCLSKSVYLKGIALATMIRIDTNPQYIEQILESGASLSYYMKTCNNPYSYNFFRLLNNAVAELLVKSTNNQYVLHHIVTVKSREIHKKDNGICVMKESLTELLIQADYPLLNKHLEQYTRLQDTYRSQVMNLKYLCRNTIRGCLIPNVLFGVKYLPLPAIIKAYIKLEIDIT